MSAPKTYAAYVRRATERGETPLTRENWKKQKSSRSRVAQDDRDIAELERLADQGDSCAMAELEALDNE